MASSAAKAARAIPNTCRRERGRGGVTHPASSKYQDEIISFAFIHTKSGEPIVIMVFRRAIQKALCLSPPSRGALFVVVALMHALHAR